MRKFSVLLLALTAALCLTTVAFADVIAGPMIILWGITKISPYLLVAAVVMVTVILLRKFRKK